MIRIPAGNALLRFLLGLFQFGKFFAAVEHSYLMSASVIEVRGHEAVRTLNNFHDSPGKACMDGSKLSLHQAKTVRIADHTGSA